MTEGDIHALVGENGAGDISRKLLVNGQEFELNSVKSVIRHKIAYVSEDRKNVGLILSNAF